MPPVFTIQGRGVYFRGQRVAVLCPEVWPSLQSEVVEALAGADSPTVEKLTTQAETLQDELEGYRSANTTLTEECADLRARLEAYEVDA
jgi:hypothetical protein